MRLSYKTRENLSPQGKPRVYYTGHTDDFSLYFEQIAEEILELHNCVIYYDAERLEDTEGKSKQEDVRAAKLTEEEKYELGQMQLFVIPVTGRFLFEPNRARKVEFPFAIMNHIPILPLIQGSGLEAQFNQICGNLQMLDAGCQDPTALPYEEKLKHFLNSVLVGDELAEKIRGAFDAYVFLSYRKKDRIYAQELMRLIHKNKFCRDIAIWYDEFLTPGENFNTEIENALEKSELFVLAVTPHILEPGNYALPLHTAAYPAIAGADRDLLLRPDYLPVHRFSQDYYSSWKALFSFVGTMICHTVSGMPAVRSNRKALQTSYYSAVCK